MTDPNDEPKKPSINAENNSIAVGSISAGGNIGDIHIGNVYQTPEDDLPLSSDEIENGLTRFAQYLPERAPVLQDSFSSIAKKLRTTLGADQNSLSPAMKAQREDGVNRMKLMCMEVMDISFRAICLGQNPPPYDSRPPFLGLFAFRPEDREFFFGRDALVQKLVARIKAHPFLAVLGASGSGKSSLVMAGLVPALEAQMSYLTPSSAPLSQLLTAKESASAKTVFVIDQFEELFTHPHDAAERSDFIHALLELTKMNRVVITMRADFWGEVAIYSDLKQAMQEHQELIAPMTVDELHSAMEKQAAVVGLRFDPTLSESILAEVKGEPGAMPLLQHALWELWNRRHGLWIKAEEYQAFGGVKQAIASTAEEVYASCSDFERDRIRDIFLRLTRLDESGEGRDTRRRVLIEELIPGNSDSSVTIKLLNKLADARLIVKTNKDVEVAHEALIRYWSRLTNWLNEDRNNLRLCEGVSESAREWGNSNHDDSLLNHRGGRLEDALTLKDNAPYGLTALELSYLNACAELRNKQQRERERRLRYTVIASIAAAVIFLVLSSFGLVKSNEATNQAGTAQANANIASTAQINAEIERQRAEEQKNIAIANELSATSLTEIDKHFDLALLLGVESIQKSNGVRTKGGMLSLLQSKPEILFFLQTNQNKISALAYNLDGKVLVIGDTEGNLKIWDVSQKETPPLLINTITVANNSPINVLTINHQGNLLAAATSDGDIFLWNITNYKDPKLFTKLSNAPFPIYTMTISPNDRFLAYGGLDKKIVIWDITDPANPKNKSEYSNENIQDITAISFSPDGYRLCVGSLGIVQVMHIDSPSQIVPDFNINEGLSGWVYDIDFDPSGKLFAVASGSGEISLWEFVNDFQQALSVSILKENGSRVNALAFSPDGKKLASSSIDNTIILWNISTPSTPNLIKTYRGHSSSVGSIAFNPDGNTMASGSADGKVIVWNIDNPKSKIEVSKIADEFGYEISIAPSKSILASGLYNGDINVWNTENLQDLKLLTTLHGHNASVTQVLFAPSGNLLISSAKDRVVFWDFSSSKEPYEVGAIEITDVDALAINPDEKILATGNDKNSEIILWDISNPKEPIMISSVTGKQMVVYSLAFYSDGKFLASGGLDGSIVLWNVSNPKKIPEPNVLKGDGIYISSLVFRKDRLEIISGNGDSFISIWDMIVNAKKSEFIGHNGSINDLILVDENILASASSDTSIILWDLVTMTKIGVINGHDNSVNDLLYDPIRRNLVSASYDDTIKFWDISTQSWVHKACDTAGRNFTRAEWVQYFLGESYRITCPQWPLDSTITPTETP